LLIYFQRFFLFHKFIFILIISFLPHFQLIALARVLAPIVGHPACQQRVSLASQRVRQAVDRLLAHMHAGAARSRDPHAFGVCGTTKEKKSIDKSIIKYSPTKKYKK
jgi:hypothetical protein